MDVGQRSTGCDPGQCCRAGGCGQRVHAKISKYGHRFFAHDWVCAGCPSSGESAEHLALKAAVIAEARRIGWDAEPEVAGEGWRADVLVSSPDETRRVAWEVQLASMTAAEGAERSARMEAAGVSSVWLTTRNAPWLLELPSARVSPGVEEPRRIHTGCARLEHSDWVAPEPFPLAGFVTAVLRLQVECHVPEPWPEHMRDHRAERVPPFRGAHLWLKPSDWSAFSQARRSAAAADARREADRQRHIAAIEALWERQQRLLPTAMRLAREATGNGAWAGDPPRWHAANAGSGPRYGMGVPIWTGRDKPDVLWAIVCPVASRLQETVSRLRGVLLIAETAEEMRRMERANAAANVQVVTADSGWEASLDNARRSAGRQSIRAVSRRMAGF